MDSILDSIKRLLGLDAEDTTFDMDIIMHINTTLMILTQLGVGPSDGFSIYDNTAVWTDFTTLENVEGVRTYVYLRVRMLFDPPSSSYVLDSMKQNAAELEWRLKVATEVSENV